jgi:hypothetical protein
MGKSAAVAQSSMQVLVAPNRRAQGRLSQGSDIRCRRRTGADAHTFGEKVAHVIVAPAMRAQFPARRLKIPCSVGANSLFGPLGNFTADALNCHANLATKPPPQGKIRKIPC